MSVFHENMLIGASGQVAAGGISRSLRFNSSDSAYLSRTPASAGNRKTWTWAGWVKRSGLGANGYLFEAGASDTASARFIIRFSSDNTLLVTRGQNADRITSQVFRDVSAWCHLVVAVDTTQATANDRIKIYFNGTQITAFSSTSNPGQNDDLGVNAAAVHAIGRSNVDNGDYFNGYLADVHLIEGQALTPSSFTEVSATTGQLIPKAYTGTFGTNGFWLKFSDNSAATATTLGKDYSPNGNNWTSNNLSVTAGAGNDSLVDTPTSYGTGTSGGDVRGNFATWNPLDTWLISGSLGLANGNLDSTPNATNSWKNVRSTFSAPSGKWYYELTFLATSGNTEIGVFRTDTSLSVLGSSDPYAGQSSSAWVYQTNGRVWNSGSYSTYTSASAGDVAIIAFDVDAGKIWFGLNGTWFNSGNPASGTNALYTNLTGAMSALLSIYNASESCAVNFGQRAFAYTAPSGFKALVDTNLTAPVVAKPNTVFDVALYSGNDTTQTITLPGAFSPDLVWLKPRNAAINHALFDIVRGATKRLISNLTNAEDTVSAVTAFNSNGWSMGGDYNSSGTTYVGWAWDAGSSTVTNTQGSITSSVRANATAGFSIVTYTGTGSNATVGHGLGVAPFMFIVKNRGTSSDWDVYHGSLATPATSRLVLQSTAAVNTGTSNWNSTNPTSTVVSLGVSTSANANGNTHVMYCFAPVAGYSSFGSYVGNGTSGDGVFVYTGFRVRWLLIKQSSAAGEQWFLLDSARSPYNIAQEYLCPSASFGETSAYNIVDFLSNGFKLRATGSISSFNGSGATYIYAAFAESPFAYSRAR